ncbi:sugar kinase [Aurantiacibacter poecillastricola]|uniref:sugar kinase n=1 Tax=Aurantiacibacter poecillastricola TaxID=3064385 RepID=UPI00273EE0C9|nr:sugar kinase [Aurantiacibacter sp. 219JJ12-13]MDP5262643.1 sugar kinase [Aurantiacibacter sp. 219JJ12-13]
MVELRQAEADQYRLGYGGDTLNTAIHMARSGHDVAFASALGRDSFSERLRSAWEQEGLDCSTILTDPVRGAGLYAISLDAAGERSFTYWRSDSAARQLFALPGTADLLERVERADMLAFSLISLAILPDAGREALISLAARMKGGGGKVAFDANYRPNLWENAQTAAYWRDKAIAMATHGLPTLEDEELIGGPIDAPSVARHWQGLGCAEVVVKLGSRGCLLPDGEVLAPEAVLSPVDTSGAGDAFNAGYLSARLKGAEPRDAARRGNALAAWVIMRAGAIPPLDSAAPYSSA